MDDVEIAREERGGRGRYVIPVGEEAPEMSCRLDGGATLAILHTGVPSHLGGRGLGQAMVRRAHADARREGRFVVPIPPSRRP